MWKRANSHVTPNRDLACSLVVRADLIKHVAQPDLILALRSAIRDHAFLFSTEVPLYTPGRGQSWLMSLPADKPDQRYMHQQQRRRSPSPLPVLVVTSQLFIKQNKIVF